MANSYRHDKFRTNFAPAIIEGDASKSTVSLDDNYEAALAQMKEVVNKINAQLDATTKSVQNLNTHKDTGKEAQDATRKCVSKIKTVKQNLNTTLTTFTNAVNQAEKAEMARMRKWIQEQMALQSKTKDSTIGGVSNG